MKTMVLGQGEVLHVRFFDDDSKELLAIRCQGEEESEEVFL